MIRRTGFDRILTGPGVVISLLLAVGCTTVGPDYEAPAPEIPDAWATAAVEGLSEGDAALQTWWKVRQQTATRNVTRNPMANGSSAATTVHFRLPVSL